MVDITTLRAATAETRDDAYRAADQLADDVLAQNPKATSLASDSRAAGYNLADVDFHDRNAAIDRLANAPQHPTGNPDSTVAQAWLRAQLADETEPLPEPAPRNRMTNDPRPTFTGGVQEFLALKAAGTPHPDDDELAMEHIEIPEAPQPRQALPGDLSRRSKNPLRSPVVSETGSGMTPETLPPTQEPSARPEPQLLADIAATLARTAR